MIAPAAIKKQKLTPNPVPVCAELMVSGIAPHIDADKNRYETPIRKIGVIPM